MLKKGRNTFAYPSFFLNLCYKTCFFSWIICKFLNCPYLCSVFFIVLDLRLTKVGVQRYSFFYARTLRMEQNQSFFTISLLSPVVCCDNIVKRIRVSFFWLHE